LSDATQLTERVFAHIESGDGLAEIADALSLDRESVLIALQCVAHERAVLPTGYTRETVRHTVAALAAGAP
jgi:hypothetical protein